jgi:predicted DNA-binding protein
MSKPKGRVVATLVKDYIYDRLERLSYATGLSKSSLLSEIITQAVMSKTADFGDRIVINAVIMIKKRRGSPISVDFS